MALAGPATSLVIAASILTVSGFYAPWLGVAAGFAHGGFLVRLFWVNVVIAVFNPLPAFPMDGGPP